MAGGRPTKYKEEFADQARKLCLLGMTNENLASYFEVSPSSIDMWLTKHDHFSSAVKEGRQLADADVANSLFRRAVGAVVPENKVICHEGIFTTVPTEKHFPPDTAACIIWLKNRQPGKWREKPSDHDGDDDKVKRFNERAKDLKDQANADG